MNARDEILARLRRADASDAAPALPEVRTSATTRDVPFAERLATFTAVLDGLGTPVELVPDAAAAARRTAELLAGSAARSVLTSDHPLVAEVATMVQGARQTTLVQLGQRALAAIQRAGGWLIETMGHDPLEVEAGARRFALTLGRSLELALLVRQAQYALDTHADERSRAAAERFAREPFDLVGETSREDARALAIDAPLS